MKKVLLAGLLLTNTLASGVFAAERPAHDEGRNTLVTDVGIPVFGGGVAAVFAIVGRCVAEKFCSVPTFLQGNGFPAIVGVAGVFGTWFYLRYKMEPFVILDAEHMVISKNMRNIPPLFLARYPDVRTVTFERGSSVQTIENGAFFGSRIKLDLTQCHDLGIGNDPLAFAVRIFQHNHEISPSSIGSAVALSNGRVYSLTSVVQDSGLFNTEWTESKQGGLGDETPVP
ncbi:MAG: hypothetical protein LBF84_03005 [Holosporales bacterium]|jgi:hypothetical protein|nr:hypothetical protein [Holosporales bacterium]